MDPEEFERLFGTADTELNSGGVAPNSNELLDRIEDALIPLERGDVITGTGPVEEFFTGRMPNTDGTSNNTGLQNGIRMLADIANPDAARARSIISNFDSAFFDEVASILEGQGQVSNFERQAGALNLTTLNAPGRTDEQNVRELKRLYDAIDLSSYRQRNNINVDENGFETIDGQYVITYRGSDGQPYFQNVDKPTLYVPEWAGEDDLRRSLAGLPADGQVVYNGQIYTRQENAEASTLTRAQQ